MRPHIQRYVDDFEIIKFLGTAPWPYPKDGAKTFISDMLEKGVSEEIYIWTIRLKNDATEAIGIMDYRFDGWPDNRGFWIGKPFHGQGLMSEAVIRTQDFIFLNISKDKIIVRNAVSNVASRTLKEKFGARLLGVSSETYHSGDTEEEIWEITRDSWIAARARLGLNPPSSDISLVP